MHRLRDRFLPIKFGALAGWISSGDKRSMLQ